MILVISSCSCLGEVMEYMDLIDCNELWDPSSIFSPQEDQHPPEEESGSARRLELPAREQRTGDDLPRMAETKQGSHLRRGYEKHQAEALHR
ncbi:hypothetical protein SASPL_137798 [Salvia splendens]|uniref:Uncharacterized protein n=1 Tax=Salvia splendens TaxID=180675 RepID=A0A8X8WVM8_SALSN|nr:hypothetical protein SASPL_137798 [Salvia splendens]